jgi:hypothetical protein
MRLSTQLLLGIVGITIISQGILGLIAYWIVADVDRLHVIRLLQQQAEDVAHNVAIPLVTGDSDTIALEQTSRHFSPGAELALIVDHKGIRGIAGPSRGDWQ